MVFANPISAPQDSDAIRSLEADGWPLLPRSTYSLLKGAAETFGTKAALSFFLEARRHRHLITYSYSDLLARVTQTANLFASLGVGANDVVALILPNLPETHFCLWGGEAAGVAFPINPLLEPAAIAELLEASEAKVVVTIAPFPGTDLYDKVQAALAAAPGVRDLVLVELAGLVAGWRRWPAKVVQQRSRKLAAHLPSTISVHWFNQAVKRQPHDWLISGRRIGGTDTASMFATGGTTGSPKIALRTHANEVANAWMASRLTLSENQSDDTVFCGLPLFHVNGAMVTGLAAFLLGMRVLVGTPQGYRGPGLIERFWEIAAYHGVGSFSGVPTLFSTLLQRPTDGHDLSRLAFAICGAAPMSPELISQFQTVTGVKILEGYGLTEATCVAAVHSVSGEQRVGSVGLPLPFQRIVIGRRDPEGGTTVRKAGEVGSVLLAGPNVFQGYKKPEHNEGLWVDLEGERWLDTGDLGFLDDDGFLWLKGRSKDLIIRGGHNLDPAMIEDAFYSHSAVALAAAIGRPDPHAGEVPVVYVQLAPGAHVSVEELSAHAEANIHERAARPKAIYFTVQMPLTAIGKVHKPSLRETDHANVEREQA